MKRITIFILITLVVVSMNSQAAEWKPLSGIYAVTAENYLDPAEGEPDNTHYRLQLDGAAAEDLFHALPSPVSMDECTGTKQKISGDMKCLYYEAESRYECAFSINLQENRIEYGVAC